MVRVAAMYGCEARRAPALPRGWLFRAAQVCAACTRTCSRFVVSRSGGGLAGSSWTPLLRNLAAAPGSILYDARLHVGDATAGVTVASLGNRLREFVKGL